MTFDFFEGAAGTGKTHNLVGRAGEIVQEGALGEGHKLLALTFMNGARRRLDVRLGENPAFHRRYDCQTFDVFARTLAARRRSLITPAMQAQADVLSEFDGPCASGGMRFWKTNPCASGWREVSRWFWSMRRKTSTNTGCAFFKGFRHRPGSSRRRTPSSAFTTDATPRLSWVGLKAAGQTHRLTQIRRTNSNRAFSPPRWPCAKGGM